MWKALISSLIPGAEGEATPIMKRGRGNHSETFELLFAARRGPQLSNKRSIYEPQGLSGISGRPDSRGVYVALFP